MIELSNFQRLKIDDFGFQPQRRPKANEWVSGARPKSVDAKQPTQGYTGPLAKQEHFDLLSFDVQRPHNQAKQVVDGRQTGQQ